MERNSKAWFALLNGRVLVCADEPGVLGEPCAWLKRMGYTDASIEAAVGGHMDDSGVYFYRLVKQNEEVLINPMAVSTLVTWYTGNFGWRPTCVYTGINTELNTPISEHQLSEFCLGIPTPAIECGSGR